MQTVQKYDLSSGNYNNSEWHLKSLMKFQFKKWVETILRTCYVLLSQTKKFKNTKLFMVEINLFVFILVEWC